MNKHIKIFDSIFIEKMKWIKVTKTTSPIRVGERIRYKSDDTYEECIVEKIDMDAKDRRLWGIWLNEADDEYKDLDKNFSLGLNHEDNFGFMYQYAEYSATLDVLRY